jgi:hypothetical protein
LQFAGSVLLELETIFFSNLRQSQTNYKFPTPPRRIHRCAEQARTVQRETTGAVLDDRIFRQHNMLNFGAGSGFRS